MSAKDTRLLSTRLLTQVIAELTCRMKLEYRSVMGAALALESPSVALREEGGSGGGAGWPSWLLSTAQTLPLRNREASEKEGKGRGGEQMGMIESGERIHSRSL